MVQNSIGVRLITRNDTSVAWEEKNPVLMLGELGLESDTGLLKAGDDIHPWVDLPYINFSPKRLFPEVEEPFVEINFTVPTKVEVGTTLTPAYSAILHPGSYTYGPETGIVAKTWKITTNNSAEVKETEEGSFAYLLVTDDTDYSISATATYDAGTLPFDSFGYEYPEAQIPAGSKSATTEFSLKGYRNFFYGVLETSSEEEPLSSSLIRTLTKGGDYDSEKEIVLSAKEVSNAKRFIIAYPASTNREGLKEVNFTSSLNFNILDNYTLHEEVEVFGANSYTAIPYKVFVYEPAEIDITEVHTARLA